MAFNQPVSTAASAIAATCIETLGRKELPAKVSLYAAQPKLEIVSVGATAAVVAAGEDFEIQCILRNIGSAPFRQSGYRANRYQRREVKAWQTQTNCQRD